MIERDDDPVLLSVAGAVSAGTDVDWNDVLGQLEDPEHSAVAEELRVLERFSRASAETATLWGPFIISGEIGRGAFGTVYRAIDPNLQLQVALKVLRSSDPDVPLDVERALREGRILARISHPNVVRIYRAERIDNEVALAMELVKGHTLDELVRQHSRYSANEAMLIGLDLCRALSAVHAEGIVHGDIKAHNVMREDGGRIVLMDFGAGKDLRSVPRAAGADFAGTPVYLAPEVFAGYARTPASDIYSVGVLLYYLVTGSYPVEGDTRSEIGRRHGTRLQRRPVRDVRPNLPAAFVQAIDRAMAEIPEQRYQTAGAFEEALTTALASPEKARGAVLAPLGSTSKTTRTSWLPAFGKAASWRPLVPMAAAVVVIAILALNYWLYSGFAGRNSQTAASRTTPPVTGGTPQSGQGTRAPTYTIDAAVYRVHEGSEVALKQGDRVSPGDALSLQVQASAPVYLYVVNEDDNGESYLLFPLPGLLPENPLQPGQRHRIPGVSFGEKTSWQITSAGGSEHFLIVASPQRSLAFEQRFASLPQPTVGKPILSARLERADTGLLRAVGGLTSPGAITQQLHQMVEFREQLREGEETAQGPWRRQVTFENPAR
jgi:serine/threonine protein kinase